MRIRNSCRRRAFTLVEMLVVIGIIVVLVALLVPMGSIAVSRFRDAAMSLDVSQLETAINKYKEEKGDFPPSMGERDLLDVDGDNDTTESLYLTSGRYTSVCERHLRTCYPNMTQAEKDVFYQYLAPYMTPAESLWFWLSQTQKDERQPFFSNARTYKNYYDFKQDRVIPTKTLTLVINGNNVSFQLNAYKAAYARETGYIYLDARTYVHHRLASTAADGVAQPYGDYAKAQEVKANGAKIQAMTVLERMAYQYMNPTTFQILCAGQDGEWGAVSDQFNANGYPIENNLMPSQPNQGLRQFKEGIVYNDADKDNLANFSQGKRLGDQIP